MAKGSPKNRGKDEEVVSTVKRMLPVEIDPKAISKKEKQITKLLTDKRHAMDKLNELSLPLKKDIKTYETQIEALRASCENGTEDREVKCEVIKDFKRMKVVVRRKDDNTVVEDRTMTAEDRQVDIEGRAKKGRGRKDAAEKDEPDSATDVEDNDQGQEPEDDAPEDLQ